MATTRKRPAKKAPRTETKPKPLARLRPPKNGITVRMYRQGHGDCFLLACPRPRGREPYYILIDCGFKPGSGNFLPGKPKPQDVAQHIHDATGGRLDLVILTHEHQDHLNGIWKSRSPYFEAFDIREAWLAWTEDPDNDLANELRRRHRDQLLGLIAARRELATRFGADSAAVQRLDAFLSLETGSDAEAGVPDAFAAAADPTRSVNKQAMKFVRDKAALNAGYYYLYPGNEVIDIEGTAGLRAYVLGPPEDADLIADEDPKGSEAFPRDSGLSFAAAAQRPPENRARPFSRQFWVRQDEALFSSDEPFYRTHYGSDDAPENVQLDAEVESNAPWRRIDQDWLLSAENLAIKLNTGVNNTSLVVAFELPRSRKVLLFVGDAQRGNWRSWAKVECTDGDRVVTARDILRRTVLYKVGHHGSHNATLAGTAADPYPNLGWMGLDDYASDFAAMIPAVNEWAMTNRPPWHHPLPSIQAALLRKAEGRVFQSDIDQPAKPGDVPDGVWNRFLGRSTFEDLYFDYDVLDE
jgi:hypothetical protein